MKNMILGLSVFLPAAIAYATPVAKKLELLKDSSGSPRLGVQYAATQTISLSN